MRALIKDTEKESTPGYLRLCLRVNEQPEQLCSKTTALRLTAFPGLRVRPAMTGTRTDGTSTEGGKTAVF
jgi:hypothetical protein